MAAVEITPADLAPFASIPEAKAVEMIADALAIAALDAPCILLEDFEHAAAAKAIIRGAILRWHDSGAGGVLQESRTDGPFTRSLTLDKRRDGIFTEAEIDMLKRLCSGEATGAFDIDTVPSAAVVHAEVCSINFGATYCSCGAVLTQGMALWEVDP